MKITKTVCILLLFLSVPCFSSMTITGAYFRKVHQLDKGTIHIFFQNTSNQTVQVEKVFYNGIEMDTIPNDFCIWYQTVPPVIGPGEFTNLKIKQRWDTNKLIRISALLSNGEIIDTVIEPVSPELKFSFIGYSQDYKQVYIYLKNQSKTTIKPKKVYLDTEDVTGRTTFFTSEIILGEKGFLKVDLEKPLKQGKYIYVRIETSDGETVQSFVRVFSFFPITSYSNPDTREELNFDSHPFHIRYRDAVSEEEMRNLPLQSAWYLLGCPNCADKSKGNLLGNSAVEIIKRAQTAYRMDSTRPSHTHVCEADKDRAYFIYGEVCDIMFINPYEVVFHSADPVRNGYFANLGKIACEPIPLMTIPEAFEQGQTNPFPSPEQMRLGVYYQLSEGVKGISYYVKSHYQRYPELEREIGRINKELQTLKSYLKIGEPFTGLASSSEPKVIANTIVSADKGLVVILINTDYETVINDDKRHTTFTPHENFTVDVKIPGWLDIKNVKEVGQETKDVKIQNNGKKITVPVDRINLTKVLLFTAEDEMIL